MARKKSKKPEMSVIVESIKDYIFNNVPEEHSFYVKDGSYIKNLHELAETMLKMEDHVFDFHSNELKNDFSNWVKEVAKEEELALELLEKNKKDSALTVFRHIVNKLK